jgi:hypothetical protein
MSRPGYVYALINPTMPNLVKVGKTERDPEEHAPAPIGAALLVPGGVVVAPAWAVVLARHSTERRRHQSERACADRRGRGCAASDRGGGREQGRRSGLSVHRAVREPYGR